MEATNIEALIARLGHDNPRWRAEAEAQLIRRGAEVVPGLIAALANSSVTVRVHAAQALGKLRASGAAQALAARLSDSEANGAVAIAAERALVELGDPSPLLGALEGACAARALRALGQLGRKDEAILKALRMRLDASEATTRTQAAVALLTLVGEDAIAETAPLLGDSDKWVRYGVAEPLARCGVRRAEPVLRAALADDEEGPWIRGWAEELLSELEDMDRNGRARD